eukprot:3320894-Lingulodinium_polyedra.AAC.1
MGSDVGRQPRPAPRGGGPRARRRFASPRVLGLIKGQRGGPAVSQVYPQGLATVWAVIFPEFSCA